MPQDWNVLSTPLVQDGHVVRKVDLWKYLECRSVGLKEFGAVFCEEVKAQDENPILIGYSMGARLGMHAFLEDSTLWKQALFISPHYGLQSEGQRSTRRAKDAEWAAKVMNLPWSEFLKEWNGQAVLGDPDAIGLPDRAVLEKRKNAIARSFVAWSLGMQEDLSTEFIKLPATVITGANDQKFDSLWRGLSAQFNSRSEEKKSSFRHHSVPDAGHRTLWDQPAAVTQLIRELIS